MWVFFGVRLQSSARHVYAHHKTSGSWNKAGVITFSTLHFFLNFFKCRQCYFHVVILGILGEVCLAKQVENWIQLCF